MKVDSLGRFPATRAFWTQACSVRSASCGAAMMNVDSLCGFPALMSWKKLDGGSLYACCGTQMTTHATALIAPLRTDGQVVGFWLSASCSVSCCVPLTNIGYS